MIALFAQIAVENPALYTYGPLGIFCAFFMWRDVTRQQAHEKERSVFLTEMRAVRHSMDGLQRAFLVHMIEFDGVGESLRDYANKQVAKLDARMAEGAPR